MDDYEAKVYNGYFKTGYTLMDLDFDGTLELLVNCAGGSMHNNPTAVYKVINGNLIQITEEYSLDFQGVELIYNRELGQYCYACDTITRAGASGYYEGMIEYVFSGNSYTPVKSMEKPSQGPLTARNPLPTRLREKKSASRLMKTPSPPMTPSRKAQNGTPVLFPHGK